jgi:PAS domain S-box-containing protein
MGNRVAALIRAGSDQLLDRFVARLLETIPQYSRVAGPELRVSVARLLEDLLTLVERTDNRPISERLAEVAAVRAEQGFAPGDLLKATLAAFPVIREHVRSVGPRNDPQFAADYSELEQLLNEVAVASADHLVELGQQRLQAKNAELNCLNQRLAAHEKLLSRELSEVVRALQSANEFNSRVINSLSSGVLVIDAKTRRLTLFSRRAEEILGILAEKALGMDVAEALTCLERAEAERLIAAVRRSGKLPLTKMSVRGLGGRRAAFYVRAERVYDPEGEPEGTVVVFDDVTERELLIDSFSRYVSRDVLQRLLARGEIKLEGERRTCSILFADVRGFSGIAEKLAPEQLHELINAYFRVMIEAVSAHGGFVDKFVGDKVMALFAGSEDPRVDAESALGAALELQERSAALNAERTARGMVPIAIGVGINTGEVVLGNVGSEERMNFTAIGDAVNVADRLQSLAAPGETLIGETTARLVEPSFTLVARGPTPIKGRTRVEEVFAVEAVAQAVAGQPGE